MAGRRRLGLAVSALLLSVACASVAPTTPPRAVRTSPAPVVPAATTGPGFVLPDTILTPGKVYGTDKADICPHVLKSLEKARPSQAVKEQVYARYHITSRTPGQYVVDHLIPIGLDGHPNDILNLWPEPNDHPGGHNDHGFRVLNSKDLLEDRIRRLVCAGKVDLRQAQTDMATNWVAVYDRYMSMPVPKASRTTSNAPSTDSP